MEKLETAKLYGNGLVEIDSPELVSRYNECLALLGLPQTRLTTFRIDGVGWSPDIAAELANPHYLSHGDSSPLAILLTPDQSQKPVYMPYYSYQRQLMREYWSRYTREIADLTSHKGICVELDHGISRHRSPMDLFLGTEVIVRTTVPGALIKAFNEQRALIADFSNRDDAWFNPVLRNAIMESAKAYGDLRSHHFLIPEWAYPQPEYFRTSLFGGLFILRGLKKYDNMLIHEDAELSVSDAPDGYGIFTLGSRKWLNILLHEEIVCLNLDNVPRLREDIARIKECLLADAACSADSSIDFAALNKPQQKALINQLGPALSTVYFDLERLELNLEKPGSIDAPSLPLEVQHLLCQPAPSLSHGKRKVICQLLSRYRPTDVWRLYRHNKHCFYEQYRTWNTARQKWAISLITDHLTRQLSD